MLNRKLFSCCIIVFLLTNGCQATFLEHPSSNPKASPSQALIQASTSYKAHRDYRSLKTIYHSLKKGMQRQDVEHLLGAPDYSPIEGMYYYSSDREEPLGEGAPPHMKAVVGIILDYRDTEGMLTDRLQQFSIGPIGE